jgi:hypothetical protein
MRFFSPEMKIGYHKEKMAIHEKNLESLFSTFEHEQQL